MIVMFTALDPRRKCSVCQEANDEFSILANSYRFSPSYSNQLFFGIVDFDHAQEIFQSVSSIQSVHCTQTIIESSLPL